MVADAGRKRLFAVAMLTLVARFGVARGVVGDDPDEKDAALPAAAAAAQNVWPDERFEQWVFQDNRSGGWRRAIAV